MRIPAALGGTQRVLWDYGTMKSILQYLSVHVEIPAAFETLYGFVTIKFVLVSIDPCWWKDGWVFWHGLVIRRGWLMHC